MVLQVDLEGVFGWIAGSVLTEVVRGWVNPVNCNCVCPEFPPQGGHAADSCSCVCPETDLRPLAQAIENCYSGYQSWLIGAALLGAFLVGLTLGCLLSLGVVFCCKGRGAPVERRAPVRRPSAPVANLRALAEAAYSSGDGGRHR